MRTLTRPALSMVAIAVVCSLMFLATVPAGADTEEKDVFMGNYVGSWKDSRGENSARAQVIAWGGAAYRLAFYLPQAQGEERLEFGGKREGEKVVFESQTEDGKYTVQATLQNQKLNGSLTSGGKKKQKIGEFALQFTRIVSPTLGQPAPAGAVVLFDGTNTENWERHPPTWCVQGDGSMEVCSSNLVSKVEFGDAEYHVEFCTPFMPNSRGQSRGNSGVYIQGRYEVQVLDSFGMPPAWDYCGGIYKVAAPKENACLPPLEWQTYDIIFHAPRFDQAGNKVKDATITVKHNGKVIHENLTISHPTPGGVSDQEAPRGPLMLQDHGDRVRYRNIWVKPLAE